MTDYAWIVSLILPLGIVLYGYLYKNVASNKLNYFFGYKTEKTQLSKETWEYANKRVGSIWMKLGLVYTAIVIIMLTFFPSQRTKPSFIVIALALIVSIVPFPIVQKELEEKFDEEGKEIKR